MKELSNLEQRLEKRTARDAKFFSEVKFLILSLILSFIISLNFFISFYNFFLYLFEIINNNNK